MPRSASMLFRKFQMKMKRLFRSRVVSASVCAVYEFDRWKECEPVLFCTYAGVDKIVNAIPLYLSPSAHFFLIALLCFALLNACVCVWRINFIGASEY